MVLYVDIAVEVFSFLITLIIFFALLSENRDTGKIDAYFIVVFECNVGMQLSDLVSNFMLLTDPSEQMIIHVLFFCSYSFCTLTICMYACFCYSYVRKKSEKGFSLVLLVVAISMIAEVFWLILTVSGANITLYPNGEIVYEKLNWITQALDAISVLIVCIYILFNWKNLGKKNCCALISFGLLPMLAIPLELFWDNTPVYAAVTLSLLIVYIVIHVELGIENVQQEKVIAYQKKQILEGQTRIMISQMQPHFMYNVLNSIYYLCEIDSERAQLAVDTFASYLRLNMDAMGSTELLPFETELKHVEKYLILEKMRFDDTLEYEFDIKVKDFSLPALTLQPLVENAVKHGICKKDDGGKVTLTTSENEAFYIIKVIDTGCGFDINAAPKDDGRSHVGMNSVKLRLMLMCKGILKYDSCIGKGTTVTITIPKMVYSDND